MTPIFHDGEVFISTVVGSVKWRVHVKEGNVWLEEIWRTRQLENHMGGVILVDGSLHGSSVVHSRSFVCLDWKTGRLCYADQCKGLALTYADRMLYVLNADGVMGLVRPTAIGHKLVSCFKIPKGGKGKSWAHPVVCGGRLYIRHGEFLYAYSLK